MTDTPLLRPLRINEAAPDFAARTTRGQRRLSDYRGRWLAFFSHPADFTPVCTSEFIAMARRQTDFTAIGCELLGLSVDSLYSHLAWLKDIRDRFGVTWQIVPSVLPLLLGSPDRAAAERAQKAMMTMMKLDVSRLQAAYDGA